MSPELMIAVMVVSIANAVIAVCLMLLINRTWRVIAAGLAANRRNACIHELWEALAMIREEVEQHVPVPAGEHLPEPTPAAEAQVLVMAIARLAAETV